MHATTVGFAVGAAVPMLMGLALFTHAVIYEASLSRLPNTASCGMPMLGALFLIFCVSPACGAIGAAIGFSWATVHRHPDCE